MTLRKLYNSIKEFVDFTGIENWDSDVITSDGQLVNNIEIVEENIYMSKDFSKLFKEHELSGSKENYILIVNKGTIMLS